MKKSIIFFLSLYCFTLDAHSAVTYVLSTGRFGDHLLAYCHAKWISYKYTIPLLFQPFKYSDELVCHYHEKQYEIESQEFANAIQVVQPLAINADANMLYIVPFFPESCLETCLHPFCDYYFEVNWNDTGFKKEIKSMIAPLYKSYCPLDLPPGRIAVALHVRKGTNYDTIWGTNVKDLSDYHKGPLLFKIPPDSYYIAQLNYIALHYKQPLYVYLFTDDDDPEGIIQRYKNSLKEYDIIFEYGGKKNTHDSNVLEDFFALVNTPFNCLIRPDSHYSFIASKLGDYNLIISPKHYSLDGLNAMIDEVNLEYYSKKGDLL
jgi:hypothetical protein